VASVHDVAAYILSHRTPITAMKLQKLVYYSQAWSLVWDEAPIFPEAVEAWANGPVVRELYDRHRGQFQIHSWDGNPKNLTESERDTINRVLDYYGKLTSQELSNLTHQEKPWQEARVSLGPGERGNRVISHASMAEYYGGIA
jgi:uncharacterized phage-associated protein